MCAFYKSLLSVPITIHIFKIIGNVILKNSTFIFMSHFIGRGTPARKLYYSNIINYSKKNISFLWFYMFGTQNCHIHD